MNHQIESHLIKIRHAVNDLRDTLKAQREQVEDQKEQQAKLRKQLFSRTKEVNVLAQNQEDFEALQNENERLKAAQTQLTERLGKVLTYTKALTSEFRQ